MFAKRFLVFSVIVGIGCLTFGFGAKPNYDPIPIDLDNLTQEGMRYPMDAGFFIANRIADNTKKRDALSALALSYASIGEATNAMFIAELIKSSPTLKIGAGSLYPDIVINLVKHNYFDEALYSLAQMKNQSEQDQVAEHLVTYLLEDRNVIWAEAVIGTIKNPLKTYYLNQLLVQTYVELGNVDSALDIIGTIEDINESDKGYHAICIGLGDEGRSSEAWPLTGLITNYSLRYDAQYHLVQDEAESGKLNVALDNVNRIDNLYFREKGFAVVALEGIKLGQKNQALQLLDLIEDEAVISDIAVSIIDYYVSSGDFDTAKLYLETITVPDDKDRANFIIARGYAIEEFFDSAMSYLNKIVSKENRDLYFPQVAGIFGYSEKYHYAQLLVKQIKPEALKQQSLAAYIESFSRHTEFNKTVRMISDLSDNTLKRQLLENVISFYLDQGKFEEAVSYARFFPSSFVKISWFTDIARQASPSKGNTFSEDILTEAEQMVIELDSPNDKVTQLLAISGAYLDLGQREKALTLIKQAKALSLKKLNVPGFDTTHALLAYRFYEAGEIGLSIDYIESLHSDYAQVIALSELPSEILANGKMEKAKREKLQGLVETER